MRSRLKVVACGSQSRSRRGHVLPAAIDALEARQLLSAAFAPVLYASDGSGELLAIDCQTGNRCNIGNMGQDMLDLAFDRHGQLYGIGDDGHALYTIDRTTAKASYVGSMTLWANGLVVNASGTMYAS